MIVDIYRGERKEGLYLYLKNGTTLDTLPPELLKHSGKLTKAMTIALSKDKTLARADAVKVMAKIEEEGFYVQMPPTIADTYMTQIPNDKIQQ